jgi:hypothetical protein
MKFPLTNIGINCIDTRDTDVPEAKIILEYSLKEPL